MGFGGARRLLLCALVGVLAVGACTPQQQQQVAGDPTPGATSDPPAAAGDLRLAVERAFGLRAHLLVAADASSEALRRNADTIAGAISAGGGANLRDALAAHADAVTSGEVSEASSALTEALTDATGSATDDEAARELIDAASQSLVEARAAAGQKQHDEAFAAARNAFAQMVEVGRAFAAGISERLPDEYPGPRSSGVLELRSALQQLLGEHTLLTVAVTRSGAAGARNFDAAAAALNGNTEDLVRALRSTYGTQTGGFERAWRERISTLADYTVAAAGDNQDAREALQKQLRRSDGEVAAGLAALTEGSADRQQVVDAVRRLSTAMVSQIDDWVADRAAPAEREQLRGYEHSARFADILAAAIAADRPEDFADDR